MWLFLLFYILYLLCTECLMFGSASYNKSVSISDVLNRWIEIPDHCIWRKRLNPSEVHPFVFFHQRKSGGSTLRFSMNNASNELNLTRFIPVYNRVKSGVFKVPSTPRYSVYGGHFSWTSNIENIGGGHNVLESTNSCNRDNFSCLTNFREPIDRLESCIYERFIDVFTMNNISCINELPIDIFTNDLITKRFRGLFTCLNEPFRIFGTDDDSVVSSLGFDYNNDTLEVIPRFSPQDIAILSVTIERMSQCVPIVLEIPESFRLLNSTFPTLYEANAFTRFGKLNSRVNGVTCPKPSGSHWEVMYNVSRLEDALYQAVVKKVKGAVQLHRVTK